MSEIRIKSITFPPPCPTPTIVSKFGTVNVTGNSTVVYGEVWAKIYRIGDILGTSPPPDATKGAVNNFSYSFTNVPRARAGLPGNKDNNNLLRVWGDIGGQWEPSDTQFCGELASATVAVPVSAKHCIWLSWAEPNYPPGPHPFLESGDEYRPQGLVVPSDAVRVDITAGMTGADIWTHDKDVAGRESNADGLAAHPCDLLLAHYKDTPEYHAGNIKPQSFPLNKLVGIWETNDGPPTAIRDQIEIGMAHVENITAGQHTRLFLAMHDGQEWSDNQGSVNVTVVWS